MESVICIRVRGRNFKREWFPFDFWLQLYGVNFVYFENIFRFKISMSFLFQLLLKCLSLCLFHISLFSCLFLRNLTLLLHHSYISVCWFSSLLHSQIITQRFHLRRIVSLIPFSWVHLSFELVALLKLIRIPFHQLRDLTRLSELLLPCIPCPTCW